MSGPSDIREFPEIKNKIGALPKKPLFERQKAEAEAKRQRDEAETAAVYREFIKSFDNDEEDVIPRSRGLDGSRAGFGVVGPGAAIGGTSKRHFTSSNLKSGPGSLGPALSSSSRKRDSDLRPPAGVRGGVRQDVHRGSADAKSAFQQAHDDEDNHASPEDRAAPKPTIRLSSLVPGTSASAIEALLPKSLHVDDVKLIPPPTVGRPTERRSNSAVVTLTKDTPASDIDTAVNSLQNKYLGFGYRLNISRHLSSAISGSVASSVISSVTASHPFGALPAQLPATQGLAFGRGQSSHRYAPPSSYIPQSQLRSAYTTGPLQVIVKPPSDIKQLKLIHKTLEAVITHGPEFEALLMSRSDVQKEERWIWLWDARSPGGIWYRWRLWEILSGSGAKHSGKYRTEVRLPYSLLFDTGTPWQSPGDNLKFEFITDFESFVSAADYDSSDEEDDGEFDNQRSGDSNTLTTTATAEYLNPLQKAKLTHLLSRLPSTTARLRKGDVARVTSFAITHAGCGSEEVVNMLLDNVERPFVYCSSNPVQSSRDTKHPSSPPVFDTQAADDDNNNVHNATDKEDVSSSTLIALYLISDLLSSSSTSGVRNAWRYRQLFESALISRQTFSRLGNLERELKWGRLRAEKWRRAINQLLQMWEGWCVFGSSTHDAFVKAFETACEGDKKIDKSKASVATAQDGQVKKTGGLWKAVEKKAGDAVEVAPVFDDEVMEEEDIDGEPMLEEDEDVDGEPMEEDDDSLDHQPLRPINPDLLPKEHDSIAIPEHTSPISMTKQKSSVLSEKRKRPTAADMFAAESDGD